MILRPAHDHTESPARCESRSPSDTRSGTHEGVTTELDLRPATAEEFSAFYDSMSDTFFETVFDVDVASERARFEAERSLIALDHGAIVATGGIFSRELTVPGGLVAMAGVSYITVAPTHRRRGLLTRIMTRQLADLHAGGEVIAGLWASEGGIYGRFGYGSAAPRAVLTGAKPAFRPGTDLGTGRVRRVSKDEVRPHAEAVYEQLRPRTVGHLDRSADWWERRFMDPEHHRDGATPNRYLVHEETGGTVTGFAVFRIKADWSASEPNSQVIVIDLSGTTPPAAARLWRFVLDLDLVNGFRRRLASPEDPVRHLVADPRAVRVEITDSLWIRLVDVDRALAARRYRADLDVVLEVSDEHCPWNVGRWRLIGGRDGAQVRRTSDAPDLSLSVTELGAAYLGGTTLQALSTAGRVTEQTAGALRQTSLAMSWDSAPWCPEVF